MDKYIFAYIDEDREGIFRDFTSEKAKRFIDYLPTHKSFKSKAFNKVKDICLSNKLNSILYVPLQSWFYNLDNYKYNPQDSYHLLIPTTGISKMSIKYLRDFKTRHSNTFLYAIVTDSMHASSPHMDLVRDKLLDNVWDKVLTYDKYDAKEFGFVWFGYTYYSSFDFVEPDSIESDIYYVGYDKGDRDKIVVDVYNYLRDKGSKIRFDVVSSNSKHEKSLKYLKEKVSYPEVVSRVKSTNCILEVLQKNQKAQSLRYFEAVVYNKKLLTTNNHIVELPYYDERYMKCFDKVDQIDVEWISRRERIDYRYDGRFSPLKLLEVIASINKKANMRIK